MTYFFKNKKTGEVFAVDNESQASVYVYRSSFRSKDDGRPFFKYLGRSNGERYKEIISEGVMMSKSDAELIQKKDDDLNDDQKAKKAELIAGKDKNDNVSIVKRALEAELEIAATDMTPPADTRTKVPNGAKGDAIRNVVAMMG